MDAMGLASAWESATWIADRFPVPHIAKGSHLKRAHRVPRKAGFEGDIGLLVRSGLWAGLSKPTRCIVPVLLLFADWETGKAEAAVKVSYRAIGRYSGVTSPNAIAKAIRELQEIGWLKRLVNEHTGPVAETGSYVLTPQSDDLTELANAKARQMKDEIEAEKQGRRELREARRRYLKSQAGAERLLSTDLCTLRIA
jgi:DNA-binding HxlR family transcriptional regulator